MHQGHYPATYIDSRTKEDIAEELVQDIMVGVDDAGIKAEFIGEIGCSWPLTNNERKVLKAAAIAQQRTGAIITVHPGFYEDSPLEIIKILSDAGVNTTRIAICHMCLSVRTHETRCKITKTGCYLEWDLFGFEGVYPQPPTLCDLPSDQGRVRQITQLITEGYLDQILISHDICTKIGLTRFGGIGYAHILNNAVPLMQQKGITNEQVHTIMVKNPKRAFTFV